MDRLPVGSVQQHIFLWMIERLAIPRIKHELEIARVVKRAYALAHGAEESLAVAEEILIEALGLKNWEPLEPLAYTQRSSVVAKAGRCDAEFFAPRVADLMAHLTIDGLTIGDVAPPRRERFVPVEKGLFQYLEIGNLRSDGSATTESLLMEDAPSRATWYVRAGDVITSTVRPIRRLTAMITDRQNGAVCSSGFAVLRPREVAPEVLLTYLRLRPVCELMNLHTSASMYPAISEVDLLNIPFRRIDAHMERAVVKAVSASRAGRERARLLLDRAKQAVEMAIEQNEAAVLKCLSTEEA
jgi:type I restriction enzyme S subunit